MTFCFLSLLLDWSACVVQPMASLQSKSSSRPPTQAASTNIKTSRAARDWTPDYGSVVGWHSRKALWEKSPALVRSKVRVFFVCYFSRRFLLNGIRLPMLSRETHVNIWLRFYSHTPYNFCLIIKVLTLRYTIDNYYNWLICSLFMQRKDKFPRWNLSFAINGVQFNINVYCVQILACDKSYTVDISNLYTIN